MAVNSVPPHLSNALKVDHDSSTPPYVPCLLAFLASFIGGLLSFGEATAFNLMWNLVRRVGLLGDNVSFAKGVLYSTILAPFTFAPLVVINWKEVSHMLGYNILSFPVVFIFIGVGVRLLIYSDARVTEAGCCMLFMAFSAVKIIAATIDYGKERQVLRSGQKSDRARPIVKMDETETVVLGIQETELSEAATGTPHWPIVAAVLEDHPRFQRVYETVFPAISVRGFAVETVACTLLFFEGLGGFTSGLFGSGIVKVLAFVSMEFSKGAMRGMMLMNILVNITVMYRISLSHESHLFTWSECHVYLLLGLSATIGSLWGNWARQFVNREDILFGLFWLIWAECALLSHVFRYDSISSMPLVPFLYVVLTPVLILGAFLTYFFPSHIKNRSY